MPETTSDTVVVDNANDKDNKDDDDDVELWVSKLQFHVETAFKETDVERQGCREILQALTREERAELTDANMVLRYWRSEKGKVEKAVTKLRETLQWRKEYGVDAIVHAFDRTADNSSSSNDDQDLAADLFREGSDGKLYARGYDKEGKRCLLYLRLSRDTSKNTTTKMQHLVYTLERGIACCRQRETFVFVVDYSDYQLQHTPSLTEAKLGFSILQSHYPERLHRAFLVDPPFYFRTFWTLIKPFIDPATKEKIVFLHGKTGQAELQEYMALETLEASVGGTAEPPLREFQAQEYYRETPFDQTFDEQQTKTQTKEEEDEDTAAAAEEE